MMRVWWLATGIHQKLMLVMVTSRVVVLMTKPLIWKYVDGVVQPTRMRLGRSQSLTVMIAGQECNYGCQWITGWVEVGH